MALDWVRQALAQCLDFQPFPATLNVRPAGDADGIAWQSIRNDRSLFSHMPSHEGSCRARIYRIEVHRGADENSRRTPAAVLFPEVIDYPKDKIEIVAPMRLKDAFGVEDGDRLTLEFIH